MIAIFSQDLKKALFCIRAKQPYKGMYNFVGGQVENGETNDAAAYRELFEEKNKLEWVDVDEGLLDNGKFGGNYNIAHIVKQILLYLENGVGIDKY